MNSSHWNIYCKIANLAWVLFFIHFISDFLKEILSVDKVDAFISVTRKSNKKKESLDLKGPWYSGPYLHQFWAGYAYPVAINCIWIKS